MANEVDWQTKIIKRIKKEGGYGKKWATQYNVGVPDLILIPNVWTSVFTECKLEKEWYKNTTRTIAYKPKQCVEAQEINKSGGIAFGLIIIHNGPTQITLCPTPMPDPRRKFRTDLRELLRTAYDWRTSVSRINGETVSVPMGLGLFLKQAYETTIAGTQQTWYTQA